MKRLLPILAGLLVWACGKSAQQKASDVQTCSGAFSTGPEITQCLLREGGWSRADAEAAGRAQQHETDSVNASLAEAQAQAGAQRGQQIKDCNKQLVDFASCLVTRYGWEDGKAKAADDSVWASKSTVHAREIRSCAGRRGLGAGACLQLHYKWPPARALALDDSIRRAQMTR
jgi:hypothetical protein